MMTSDRYPIRTIFRKFYPEYLESTSYVSHEAQRAAECIMKCKTGELGYTVDVCEECGYPKIYAVSCNNKACPCCQAPLAKKWELERNTELIENISYYHVVFTVPHELNLLIQANEKLLLDLLFRCVTETLLNLCADKKYMGAKPGIISVLHTWGSNLSFHPHIHTCISGGGITVDNRFVETSHRGFFIPDRVIVKSCRGRYQDDSPVSWKACIHYSAVLRTHGTVRTVCGGMKVQTGSVTCQATSFHCSAVTASRSNIIPR